MFRESVKPSFGILLSRGASWDALTLPLSELTQLKALSTRLQAIGKSSSATRYGPNPWQSCQYLFYGPSGMGKLLAARMIAADLGLPVWRIPSTTLVGRYIGETEKNLDRVFKEAGERGWILFFDEADALFGKRTGVRSHHSRYANQEVSFLLQRAEDYRGVAILSTQSKPRFAGRLMHRFKGLIGFL